MTSNSDLETLCQNITGNEIANNFPYGFYVITGGGHFEYGNNDGGTVIPSSTNDFEDISCFYTERPWFVESSFPFPAIGFPHSLNQWSNPAKQRFIDGGIMTVKIEYTVGIENVNDSHLAELQVKILNNPVDHLLELQIPNGMALNYSIYNMTGKMISSDKLAQGDDIVQVPVSQLETGIYLIEFTSLSARKVLKFYNELCLK